MLIIIGSNEINVTNGRNMVLNFYWRTIKFVFYTLRHMHGKIPFFKLKCNFCHQSMAKMLSLNLIRDNFELDFFNINAYA